MYRCDTRSARRPGEEGVALLLVLLFVALLTVIVVEYGYETQVDAALATNDSCDFEAYVGARSAVAGGMAALAGDLLGLDEFSGAEYDCYYDMWAAEAPLQPMNGAATRCYIEDEYGKLNLNALFVFDENGNAVPNEMLIEALRAFLDIRLEQLSIDEDPLDAILDWSDPDSDPRENGFEDEYYGELEIPYPAKNGPMDSVEELLMVRGITPELFFGLYPEGQEPLEYEERPRPLTAFFTVHGDPKGRINVNTAQPELLEALFGAWGQDPGAAAEIYERLANEEPFISVEGVAGFFQRPEPAVNEVLTVASKVFRLQGDGRVEDARVRIEAFVWRNPGPNSPWEWVEAEEQFRILDWRVIR